MSYKGTGPALWCAAPLYLPHPNADSSKLCLPLLIRKWEVPSLSMLVINYKLRES